MNGRRTVWNLVLASLLGLPGVASTRAADTYVWWEAENFKDSNFPKSSSFDAHNDQERAKLSGGAWLTSEGNRFGPPLFVKYEVNVPKEGTYEFWTRKFWHHGEFDWHFDGRQSGHCGHDCELADSVGLGAGVGVNWVPLGQVKLSAGQHLLEIETTDTVLEKPKPPPPKPVAELVTKEFDWCTVTYPKQVAVGQRVPIKVVYHGIDKAMKLRADFHLIDNTGKYMGYMSTSFGGSRPTIQGDGETTLTVPVENTAGEKMGAINCVVYLTPDGSWEKKVQEAKIAAIPIDPESLQPLVKGAGPTCFDCFLLTMEPFTPRGKLKPGEKSGKAMPGYVAFEPDRDLFHDDAVLDLRSLNEKVAGESGWVTRKGEKFYLGDGKEVKFWATTLKDFAYTKSDLSYMLRRYAKLGMNMVRIYRPVFDATGADLSQVDPKSIDVYQYITSEAKKNGMYVSFNIYWSAQLTDMNRFGFKGWPTDKSPWMFHIWDDRMREYTKDWVRKLMTANSPYGPPLGQDPAVAMVQIQSEDTVFFYTTNPNNYPEGFWRDRIGKLFGDWLTKKYGSIAKAYEAWGGGELKGDDPAAGIAMPLPAGSLSGNWGPPVKRRADNALFYAERQQGYYRELVDTYRSSGYKGLIICQGFKTANDAVLGNFEQWSNLPGDATDMDHYFACIHVGLHTSYAVSKGDEYLAYSALHYPTSTTLRYKTAKDFGAIVDEFGWTAPSPYMAEAPFLISTYGSLEGIDCYEWFHVSAVDYDPLVTKFPWSTPELMGQMPATALIFRRGYVREAEPVVVEDFDPKTTGMTMEASKYYNSTGGDPARGYVKDEKGQNAEDLRNALTFFVGKVQTSFDPKDKPFVKDVSKYIDIDAKTVRSITGELEINFGAGLGTVNTKCAQGASGFLAKAGRIDLADVAVDSKNEFATVLVVSLDGKPLTESEKILIQAATRSLPYGWTQEPADFAGGKGQDTKTYHGFKIDSTGEYPLNVQEVHTQVTLKGRATPKKAVVVNTNGYGTRPADCNAIDGALHIDLPVDSLYTVVEF